jgi:hypothetical protein
MMASLLGASFEAFILDNEMLGHVHRAIRGIEVTEETLGLDAIRQAVLGEGHFLGGAHTMAAMERDYVYPALADRDAPSVWAEKGAPDAWARARAASRRCRPRENRRWWQRRYRSAGSPAGRGSRGWGATGTKTRNWVPFGPASRPARAPHRRRNPRSVRCAGAGRAFRDRPRGSPTGPGAVGRARPRRGGAGSGPRASAASGAAHGRRAAGRRSFPARRCGATQYSWRYPASLLRRAGRRAGRPTGTPRAP